MIDVRSRILIENKTKERIVIGCFNPSSSFAPSSPSSSSCFELFVGPGLFFLKSFQFFFFFNLTNNHLIIYLMMAK